jgi:hypothetical protein
MKAPLSAPPPIRRREFLWQFGGGLGGIALAHLLTREALATGLSGANAGSATDSHFIGNLHHPPKARRIIQLFMNGGVSQMDTFDYKPELIRLHGEKFDPGTRVEAATSVPGNLMKSPFDWKQHGQSGRWVSSVFPHLATCVDDIAFLMSMVSKTNVHGPGSYMMNTGFLVPGFPCLGAWITYGLGRLSDNLPEFVVMPDPKGLPYNQKGNFSSGFLPVAHAGTIINPAAAEPIPHLHPTARAKFITAESERESLDLLHKLNLQHLREWEGDSRLEARIASYELAARMQLSAPELLDLSGESEVIRKLYGLDHGATEDFGRRCLIARRMLERGVRFVQIWSGAGGPTGNWDNHADIPKELPPMALATDKPIAGLLKDLKGRGMLEDTLVIWSTEFGRMPFTQGVTGRDHNGGSFVSWMAGGGIRGGTAYGQSDPWSWKALENPTYCYDLHATVLHLLGIDHEKLTFRHDGSERRLTDVHGHVIKEILV